MNDAVFSDTRVQQAVFPDLGLFHRASSSASQVSLTLGVTAESLAHQIGENYPGASYLIVDSITALLKDARDRGERRRQAYELIVGLSRVCAKLNLELMLLITEYEQAGVGHPDEIPTEEYLADFVFHVQHAGRDGSCRSESIGQRHSPRGHDFDLFRVIAMSEYADVTAVHDSHA